MIYMATNLEIIYVYFPFLPLVELSVKKTRRYLSWIMIFIQGDVIKWKHIPVTGEFPAQRPVTRSFDVFSDLRLIKRLSKQSRDWWFETPSRPLWRHCNEPNLSHDVSSDFVVKVY